MGYEDFDKLKEMYTQLIEVVCNAKETDTMDEKMDCFFKMFQIVRTCLKFSPYTHFYTQVLIYIIVKTYNSKVFRTDLLFKSQIGVFIENPKYYAKEYILVFTSVPILNFSVLRSLSNIVSNILFYFYYYYQSVIFVFLHIHIHSY